MSLVAINKEEELIAALRQHNAGAFKQLYEQYKSVLFTTAYQVVQDTGIAEDILQDAFTNVWKNIHTYDATKGRLFTWLLNITRNLAISKLRSKNYKSFQMNTPLDNSTNAVDRRVNTSINIDKIGLNRLIVALKKEHQAVIKLAYFEGLTHDAIAEVLAIPVGTVKTNLRNAVLALRKNFSE